MRFRYLLCSFGFCAVLELLGSSTSAQSPTIVVRGVTVIDLTNGLLVPNQSVVIAGDRIIGVGPTDENESVSAAESVDGRGGYIIPGLWDMHAHIDGGGDSLIRPFLQLLLANGVTGVRNPWGPMTASLAAADSAIASGDLAGPPRMITAGNLIDGVGRIWPTASIAISADDGRRLVDSLHVVGVPFLKVNSSLLPETYFAIAQRAREHGLPFVGHVPEAVRAAEASEAGQRSMEHLRGVLTGCSSDEAAMQTSLLEAATAPGAMLRIIEILTERDRRALATQDDSRCRALAGRFVENETWQVPTLVTNRGDAYMRELAEAGDARDRYLPTPAVWIPSTNPLRRRTTEEQWSTVQARYERELEIVRLMAQAGVPFLTGTDTPNPWAYPGFGVHDELDLLVKAGLTPLQALQSATINPARFFNRTDDLGTVQPGKLADLVLLDSNPLVDITNTRRIRAVIADGRLYRREDLNRLLAEVEARNR